MKTLSRIFFIIFFLCTIYYPLNANAAIPHLINYQGRLTDKDSKPLEGVHSITFSIYNTSTTGSAPLWTETQSVTMQKGGVFNVMLGSVRNLDIAFDVPYWLGIKVDSDSEMTPRQPFTSAGYAIRAENGVPTGTIQIWSGSNTNIPEGWLLCDGSTVSRTNYARLFTAIGTTYGTGDGSSTFNLPNLKGRIPVGYDQSQTEFNSLAKTGGAKLKDFSHKHTMTLFGYGYQDGMSFRPGQLAAGSNENNDHSALGATGTVYTGTSGSSAQDVLNPYITLNYIIKY